ncbi:helix-turn-helix domain-containing protein [Bradyrhizobium shewense]|uniref:helix-turn-helix domain-containing protein n=1 Tax=Bradyrhizobium shewense TaxID=1761772 RepID=UPI001FD9B8D2|nr:AraC family transcriptional regulator [Bradyrhizobium shewense]
MEIRHEQQAAAGCNEPWPYYEFWGKHGPVNVLQTSTDRGWSGLSAQLCSVNKAVIPWTTPQSDIRMCVDVRGNKSFIARRAPGIESRITVRRGTVWLSPPGLQDGSVDITQDMSGVLHVYLPISHFSPSNVDIDQSAIGALGYESAFEDPLLAEMGYAIASELETETSAGRLLIECLASSLAARLVQNCIASPARQSAFPGASGALDRRRLQRVLDYIETNLEGDLTLDLMASIACLSRYHFARAFKQAVGQSPHRYVSARRLDRAKALLMQGDRSLVDIALALSFSDQASFTRAFRQATGQAPGQYRRDFGSRRHDSSPADIGPALPMLA